MLAAFSRQNPVSRHRRSFLAHVAGTAQVHLGDRPSDITARKMSDGVWRALAPPLLASLALIVGSAVGSFTGAIPGQCIAQDATHWRYIPAAYSSVC